MAIQSRRGLYVDFVKDKLLDGEWAMVLGGDSSTNDGKAIYACLGSGVVKRVVMEDEIVGLATDTYVDSKTSNHNKDSLAHADMRNQLSELKNRLNTVANSDDVSLDQLQEIVAYIKSNKTLINQITTSKVNVSDVTNNLITNVSNKPLSASMGVELKRLIDGIQVPTNISQLNNDSKFAKSTEVTQSVNQHNSSSTSHQDIRNKVTSINNALDIQTGTWTPTAVKNIAISNSVLCEYYKIGKLVFIKGGINARSLSSSGGENIIGGLPFPAKDEWQNISVTYTNNIANSGGSVTSYGLCAKGNTLQFFYWASGRSWNGDNCLGTTNGAIYFSGVYMTN